MATFIAENGNRWEVEPKDGKSFSLEELCRLLDCRLVEAVGLGKGLTMWLDEEGKLTNRAWNLVATKLLAQAGGMPGDRVCGPVLITSGGEVE